MAKVFLTWWLLAFIHFTIIALVFVAVKTTATTWIPLYIIHQIALLYVGISSVIGEPLGFASVFIVLCETVRMVMKSHSYFRTKLLYLKKQLQRLQPTRVERPKISKIKDKFIKLFRIDPSI